MAVIAPPYQLPDLRPFRSLQHRVRLVGGATVTENGVLQSDDYVPGISGWAIFGNGDVEFNDGTFRGDVEATGLNLTISENDDGAIEFYNADDELVGRLTAGAWEIGDLETPGLRATLDPLGGIRFRSGEDELLAIFDSQGISIRDDETGLVVAELSRLGLRLVDVEGGDEVTLSTASGDTIFKPRYTGEAEPAPVGTTLVIPAANLLGDNDLELGQVVAFKRATVQAASATAPAGWTEVDDNSYGVASTLATALYRRSVATGTTGTATSSHSNWDNAIGTHIVIKGVDGGTTPSVRSTSDLEVTTTGTVANLSLPKPAGTAQGDLLLAFIAMGNSGGSVPTGWVTPEGWVFLGAKVGISGSGATMSTVAVGVWAKLAGASEPADYDTDINFGGGTKTIHAMVVAVQDVETIPGGPQFNIGGYNLAGPWRPYDAVLTDITLGNGTVSSRYMLMGKTCFITFYLLFGSTTSIDAALPAFSLPFPGSTLGRQDLSGSAHDVSAFDTNLLVAHIAAAATEAVLISNTGWVSATVPHTWATGDLLAVNGVYEIA